MDDDARSARWLSHLAPALDSIADEQETAEQAGRALIARWHEPHRQYHNASHLDAVLDAIDLLIMRTVAAQRDVTIARLAAWFHDAVYQGDPGGDERASAQLAGQVLTELGVLGSVAAEVVRLVELTAHHVVPDGDLAGALLSDADLAILAADPVAYRRYAAAVRREYAHVPDDAFRVGRRAVLQSLLDSGPLFRTPAAQELWQATARANLTREIADLSGDPTA